MPFSENVSPVELSILGRRLASNPLACCAICWGFSRIGFATRSKATVNDKIRLKSEYSQPPPRLNVDLISEKARYATMQNIFQWTHISRTMSMSIWQKEPTVVWCILVQYNATLITRHFQFFSTPKLIDSKVNMHALHTYCENKIKSAIYFKSTP